MKIKTKLKACFVCILSVATGTQAAITARAEVSAANPQTITFGASIVESLSVTITDSLSTSGNPGSVLVNSFKIDVATNNNAGYVASMYSASTDANKVGSVYTSLYNSGKTSSIPTLTNASVAKTSFPDNQWGYSLDNTTYYQMKTSSAPITIASAASGYSGSKTVYFGVKADISKAAGGYSNSVTVNVVSPYSAGMNNSTPVVPSSPNSPSQDPTNSGNLANGATYVSSGSGAGNTVYHTTSSSSGTTSDTTQIISGSYSDPLGVTEGTYYTTSETTGGSSMMTGLLVASATAAVSGGLFFLLSRSKDDDSDY